MQHESREGWNKIQLHTEKKTTNWCQHSASLQTERCFEGKEGGNGWHEDMEKAWQNKQKWSAESCLSDVTLFRIQCFRSVWMDSVLRQCLWTQTYIWLRSPVGQSSTYLLHTTQACKSHPTFSWNNNFRTFFRIRTYEVLHKKHNIFRWNTYRYKNEPHIFIFISNSSFCAKMEWL